MNSVIDGISVNFHASIKIEKNNINIYIDPFRIKENFNDADYIFITHNHYDHYSIEDIKKVINDNTTLIIPESMNTEVKDISNEIIYVKPNENYNLEKLSFHTVSSYNINKNYHTKNNNWVGYNIEINGVKYYILGDSDLTVEALNEECDVIFVPVGGIYTMDYKEALELVNNKIVKYAIPIHYGIVGSKKDAINFADSLNDKTKGVILV